MPTNNNTPKLRELLNYLSEEQCAWAIGVLRQRLQQVRQMEKAATPDACIETLGLSVRACNALHSNKLYTIQDVLNYGLDRLHLLRYTGAKTADEIRTALLPYENRREGGEERGRINRLEPSEQYRG
jgi:DNA-directed RNA polymerase alpha subunit